MNCWCVLLNRPTCQNLNRSWICTNVPLDLDVTCICVFANGVLFLLYYYVTLSVRTLARELTVLRSK